MEAAEALNSHHMIREIREQPKVFEKIVSETRQRIQEIAREASARSRPETIYVIGCGSSYYAAMVGTFYHEYSLGLDSRALPSSEFFWFAPRPDVPTPILIALARSGRTSETVEATRKAMKLKIPTIAVTSDPSSTMGQECDYCLDTGAGNEQSTVMTKTFTAGALCSILLGLELAKLRGSTVHNDLETELSQLPRDADNVVRAVEEQARNTADKSSKMARFMYLGTGANFPTCLEGALKLRETSYSASEAYHAMEFRHGPFAQLEKGIQVFGVIPEGKTNHQEATLLKEIAPTGATLVPITNVPEIFNSYSYSIQMPEMACSELAPLLFMIPMQIFAYYFSTSKGLNPDRPRNLTKFVTTKMTP